MAEQKPQSNKQQAGIPKPKRTKKNNPNGNNPLKPNGPKFTFNFYWIYWIVIVVLVATLSVNWSSGPKQISWQEFQTTVLKDHDVYRIVVVNKDVVEVYIKKDKIHTDKYKSV